MSLLFLTIRGGATVLKVGGTILRALKTTWGYKNDYGCTKFAHRNGIMILKKSEKSFVKSDSDD